MRLDWKGQILKVRIAIASAPFVNCSPRTTKRLSLRRWPPPAGLPNLLRNSAQLTPQSASSSTDDYRQPACRTCFATQPNLWRFAAHTLPMTATGRLAKLASQFGSTHTTKRLSLRRWPPPTRFVRLASQFSSTHTTKRLSLRRKTPYLSFFVNFCACKNRGMWYSLLIKKHYCSQLLSNQSWFQKCFLF